MTSFWLFSLKQTKKNKRCFNINNMVKCSSNLVELGLNDNANVLTLILQCMVTVLFLVNQNMLLVVAQGGTAGAS